MFASTKQQCQAIILLLQSLGLGHVWTEEGPSRTAVDWLQNGNPLSSGEDLMLRIAFDFWNGNGEAKLGRILAVLDGRRTELVATLIAAVNHGPDMVEAWINYQLKRPPAKSPDEMTPAELLNTLGFDPKKWKVGRPA